MITQQDLPTTIEMPVRRFVNPATGSRITYVGMVHAALPAYYAQVAALLADLEEQGARIHYELVHKPTESELAYATEEQRDGAAAVKARLDGELGRFASVGLALQKDELALRETWENHDISLLGAARFYGPSVLRQQQDAEKQGEVMLGGLTPPILRVMLLQLLAAFTKAATGAMDRESAFPGAERQLATLRETIALAAVDVRLATEPGADIALVWGAAHLPGFSEGLALRGYKEESETWMTAIDCAALPPLA